MGQNRRYAGPLEVNVERAAREDATHGTPVGLTPEQLMTTGRRQDAAQRVPVRAWIPYRVVYDRPELVEGLAVAWTNDAVLVRFVDERNGHDRHTWVWASAVTRTSEK